MTLDEAINALKKDLPQDFQLDIAHNNIDAADAIKLANALKKALNLPRGFELDLFHNDIGDIGSEALANTVKEASNLPQGFQLVLYGNNIGDLGAKSFTNALDEALNLPQGFRLDLSNNAITDAGALALASALKEAPKLPQGFQLDISGNHIGDVGLSALVNALETTKSKNIISLLVNDEVIVNRPCPTRLLTFPQNTPSKLISDVIKPVKFHILAATLDSKISSPFFFKDNPPSIMQRNLPTIFTYWSIDRHLLYKQKMFKALVLSQVFILYLIHHRQQHKTYPGVMAFTEPALLPHILSHLFDLYIIDGNYALNGEETKHLKINMKY